MQRPMLLLILFVPVRSDFLCLSIGVFKSDSCTGWDVLPLLCGKPHELGHVTQRLWSGQSAGQRPESP
jgi:hypothetical protein